MKDLIIPVNNEAMSKALVGIVGEEKAKEVVAAYKAIDEAMCAGYQKGLAEGEELRAAAAKEYVEALGRANERKAEEHQEAYDDGYMDGVQDARMAPEEADDYISFLCDELEFEAAQEVAGEDDTTVKVNAHVEGECWIGHYENGVWVPGTLYNELDEIDADDFFGVADGAEGSEYTVDGVRLY